MRKSHLSLGLALLLSLGAVAYIGVFSPKHDEESSAANRRQETTATVFGWPAKTIPLAGDGQMGDGDGPALMSRFSDPFGLAVDRAGSLYIADGGDNNRIRKLSTAGTVTTFAGAQEGFADGIENAAFNTPSGLAIDDEGNVFVADTGNNAIRMITPQGMVTTLAGDGIAGYRDGPASQARFNGPIGVAVDKAGNVFVADSYNDRIRMISSAGQVTTLAGDGVPGFRDGPASQARFDTPCAVLVDAKGGLLVADTVNDAIRTIGRDGDVSTLLRTLPEDRTTLFRRPVSLAATSDGFIYVGTRARGRIFQISPNGEIIGLTGLDIDIRRGDDRTLRLLQPNGLAIGSDGTLFVADSPTHSVRKVEHRIEAERDMPEIPAPSAAAPRMRKTLPWPVRPQYGVHEIVGTMGEVRGNDQGDSRDHFHAGIDVQANMGAPVLAVEGGKISDPFSTWGYETLSEGLSMGAISYIHQRVGRTADNTPIDPARFTIVADEQGRQRVRVRRGVRFAAGDELGTVNRMYHVHLEYNPAGATLNPLELTFAGLADRIPPHIEAIQLIDQDGKTLTEKRGNRIRVPSSAGDIGIIVDAFDQFDGNAARRRLGLYKVGYQILRAGGDAVAGFEQPRINLEFNQLPPDREAVKVVYAEGSGETVHGSAATHFRYVVTNFLREGHVEIGSWRAPQLPRGDYVIRIFAVDYAGNIATTGRDLPVTLE